MTARILVVDPDDPDPRILDRAAEVLRGGGLVAFPTETVYGLGAHALDPAAVRRIYEAKGRPAYNPLIVHVPDATAALRVAAEWPERAQRAARAFWPGPLTIVLAKRPEVPDEVTAGLGTVAIRVPAHPVARALLSRADLPVAAPSANRSTELSPTTAQHVARSLGDRVDLILDGGPTTVGIESAVVDLSREPAVLLRPGVLSLPELERVIGAIVPASRAPAGESPRASPGMMDRHYAPRARLRPYAPAERDRVADEARAEAERGGWTGAVLWSDATEPAGCERVVRLPADAAAYAARLYDTLHTLDDAGCTLVLVERVRDGADWDGVRDRLERAATAA